MENPNLERAYNIAVGQCTEPLRQKLEAEMTYEAIKQESDTFKLIKLIRKLMYNYQSHKYGPQATHEACIKFYTSSQEKHTDNQAYLHKFQAQVNIIDTVGGWIRYHPDFTNAVLIRMLGKEETQNASNDEKKQAGDTAQEEYLACAIIIGA